MFSKYYLGLRKLCIGISTPNPPQKYRILWRFRLALKMRKYMVIQLPRGTWHSGKWRKMASMSKILTIICGMAKKFLNVKLPTMPKRGRYDRYWTWISMQKWTNIAYWWEVVNYARQHSNWSSLNLHERKDEKYFFNAPFVSEISVQQKCSRS